MKKNININLCGIIYAIDEDACQLLQQYLDDIKSYFSKQQGGEEIADDIEHRVSELLWEKKQQGVEAIDIQTVKSILKQIGKPEEMTSEEAAQEEDNASKKENTESNKGIYGFNAEKADEKGERKLYRDTQNKMLGGVLSGLAHYFGGSDPLAWRIAFLALAFLTSRFTSFVSFHIMGPGHFHIGFGLFVIAYFIGWMFLPEAKTAEDRLKMKGKAVNTDSIQKEVIEQQEKKEQTNQPKKSEAEGCANGCLSFIVLVFKLFVISVCGIVLFALIIGAISALIGMSVVPATIISEIGGEHAMAWTWFTIICGITIVGLPLYILGHLIFGKSNPNSTRTNLILLAIWIAAWIGIGVVCNKLHKVEDWRSNIGNAVQELVDPHNWEGTNYGTVWTEEYTDVDGSTTRIVHTKTKHDSVIEERIDTIKVPAIIDLQ